MSVGDARGESGVIMPICQRPSSLARCQAGRQESTLILSIPRHGFLPKRLRERFSKLAGTNLVLAVPRQLGPEEPVRTADLRARLCGRQDPGTEISLLALASYDLTCRCVWWDEYAECSYSPGGAAEPPVLSNPHSRPVLNGALSRASGCNTRISLSCQKSLKTRMLLLAYLLT